MVLETLRDYKKARDSDQWLTCQIWVTYFPNKIFRNNEDKMSVRLKDVLDLPKQDHIKRIRAIIQNVEGRYLPTSLEVAKQRKINEGVWNAYIKGQDSLFGN